jgi:ribosome biogenesis protein Nip4
MPAKEEKISLSRRSLTVRELRILRNMIRDYGGDPGKIISGRPGLICMGEVCLISEASTRRYERATLLYKGRWLGVIYRGSILPSTEIVEEIFREKGPRNAIVVSDEGIKRFLYGRDVFPRNITRTIPPATGTLAVIDEADNSVVGFARLECIHGRRLYRNLFDLGVFIRRMG